MRPEPTVIYPLIGLSLEATFRDLAPGVPPEGLIRRFVERADQIMVDCTALYESARTVLPALHRDGYQLGIVSTKFHRRIHQILERESLSSVCEVIVGGDDVRQPKPDPEGIRLALVTLGCAPDSAVYVGDSLVDAAAARAAGVRFIGVLTGVTSGADLLTHGAAAVIDDLTSLPACVAGLTATPA